MNETMAPEMMPAAAPEPAVQAGMIDTMKEKVSMGNVMEKIKMSKDKLFEVGLYAGVGFLSGFLLKKYSTYVAVFVLILVGIGVLHQMQVINVTINWDKVTEVFGIQAAQDVTADNIFSTVWEWVRLNMVISISYLIGLFIGLKLG